MAKKTVASLQNTVRDYVKIIRTVKSDKGNYQFIEKMVKTEDIEKYLNK